MSRRSTAQSKHDDLAFPVRIKFAVPPHGLGKLTDEMHTWLRENLGAGHYACHATTSIGTSATAVYFRTVDDARAFVAALPDLALADGTVCRAYVSPVAAKSIR